MTPTKKEKINILVTLDENYVPYLNIMLSSMLHSNRDCFFDVYLLHSAIREDKVLKQKKSSEKAESLL